MVATLPCTRYTVATSGTLRCTARLALLYFILQWHSVLSQDGMRCAKPYTTDLPCLEAAGGVLFLASPLATYVTGHTLEVTGGMGI